MGKNGIPDRWLPYSPMGSVIPGTRFIACKVPLKDDLLRSLPENQRFGPKDLLSAFPKIGLLIDLTNTMRYYFKQDFTDKNIRYEKIFCPGKVVPPNSIIKKFFVSVDDYLASENDPDAVIVVHCTHGVNRTGYFICRYMIEKLKMSPEEAVKNFQLARGHDIERDTYVCDLKNGCKGGNEADLYFVSNRGFGRDRKTGGDRRGGGRHMTNYRRSFHGKVSNKHDEFPEERQRNDYKQNSNNYYPNGKWRNSKHSHPYFKNVDGRPNLEIDSKYSYNWRDHGKSPNSSFPSTIPLPQFTPVRHQGSSTPPCQPLNQSHHEKVHSAVYDGAKYPNKGHFITAPSKSFGKAPHKGFNPFPKFCHPETSNESGPASRLAGGSIADTDNSHCAPVRSTIPPSNCRGNFRGRTSSRGGDSRGRSRDNRGGSRRWNRGNGPQRNNYSR